METQTSERTKVVAAQPKPHFHVIVKPLDFGKGNQEELQMFKKILSQSIMSDLMMKGYGQVQDE